MTDFDTKMIFAIAAIMIGLVSQIPYLIAIFNKQTKPHAFTWLIWSLTQGTAAAGLWYGNGGLVAIGLMIATVMVFMIFLLSLHYGTKDVTGSDALVLVAAIVAVFFWWQLDNPVLAVIMVSIIDGIGYIPTFRKSFKEPWSEDILAWILISISYLCSLAALNAYNLLTVPYLVTITVANTILVSICLLRRRQVKKPQPL